MITRSAIAAICGCLIAVSCSFDHLWPLAWVAWAPVLWMALDEGTPRPWLSGLICGLAGNAVGYYWLLPYMRRFAELPTVAALGVFVLFAAYHSLSWALVCQGVRWLRRATGLPVALLAPTLLVALEASVPTFFAWHLALTQARVLPVIQVAELTGPLGVSFLVMLGNAVVYEVVRAWRRQTRVPGRDVVVAVALVVACLAYGVIRMRQVAAARDAAPSLLVGVVQANIGIDPRGQVVGPRQFLATQQRISAELERAGAGLVVWPESAYPYAIRRSVTHDMPAGDPRRIRAGFDIPLIFGGFTFESDIRRGYNSALLLDGADEFRGRFDKNILIPFGEHVPFSDRWPIVDRWLPQARHLTPGADVAVLPVQTPVGTVRVGPMICYEDIFASFGRRRVEGHPNLLVNLTNDAWFGDTREPWQHLNASVFRAVELRLDLVRAVNNGVSSVVDATGRVRAVTRVVDADAAAKAGPDRLLQPVAIQDPQTLYARLGEWFGGVCIGATLLMALRARRRPA